MFGKIRYRRTAGSSNMKYIYLSHPITKEPFLNINKAVRAASVLHKLGYVVMVPGLTVLYDMIEPTPYEEYMRWDFAWIEKCDCVIRMPGESQGADREVKHAINKLIPVFYGIEGFLKFHYAEKEVAMGGVY